MEFIPDILNILSTVGIVNGLRLPAAGHHCLICRPVSPPALRSCPAILGAQAPALMGDHHEPGLIGPATWFRIEVPVYSALRAEILIFIIDITSSSYWMTIHR